MKSRVVRFEGGTKVVSRTLRQAIVVAVALPVMTFCTGSTEPAASVSIVPASQTVAIQPSVHGPTLNVSVTMTNTSPHAIYWSSCGVGLQRKNETVGAGKTTTAMWQTVWLPICATIATVFDPLQPGESVTVPITAVVSQVNPPTFDGAPGLYRVRFSLSTEVAGSIRALPEDQSSSDPFTVVTQ
jgi:hypothetical protein